MKWYVPAWNGDVRLVDQGTRGSTLVVIEPTEAERKALDVFQVVCKEKGWWSGDLAFDVPVGKTEYGFDLSAGVLEVGPALVRALRGPNPATLTAVKFDNGGVVTAAGTSVDLAALAQQLQREEKASSGAAPTPEKDASRAFREPSGAEPQPGPEAEKKVPPKPEAAATVKRPTPSCPQCVPGSVEPAREVLLSFLSEEQHERWAARREIVVVGGLTGTLYLLAHRHSDRAQYQGRICFDMDGQSVVHFHDTSVPPEEEVLAAKLILEHREPWLRNQATMLGAVDKRRHAKIFSNPFGNAMDGVEDATMMNAFGKSLVNSLRAKSGLDLVDFRSGDCWS